MAIEVKPSTPITGNVLVPSQKTPPVLSITTTLPMDTLQTYLNCREFNYLICHLVVFFFYLMEDQVIHIKLIKCTAIPRVNPLLVSNDKAFKWHTVDHSSADHVVLLVEMRHGNSYILDPSFLALDPSGSYEKPYGIFRTDDRELNKWYKHMEFASDFCSHTSMKVISEYQGFASLLKMLDDDFGSSICTVLQSFNNPTPPLNMISCRISSWMMQQ